VIGFCFFGHAEYASYYKIRTYVDHPDFSRVVFKKECNATVQMTCRHPEVRVDARHQHSLIVRNHARVKFIPKKPMIFCSTSINYLSCLDYHG